MRQGDWKLVAAPSGPPWQLYNLAADPIEMHDQAPSDPVKVREMITLYDAWSERCGVRPWPEIAPSP